jgi:uncharacterized protein YqeY
VVLRKLAKMRTEAIEMFDQGGASERADAERAELAIIDHWLPKLASEEVTRAWVQDIIASLGKEHVGKIMGALMKAHKADLDGVLAQRIVKEECSK